jgi:hypothetical protein
MLPFKSFSKLTTIPLFSSKTARAVVSSLSKVTRWITASINDFSGGKERNKSAVFHHLSSLISHHIVQEELSDFASFD